MRPRLTYCIAVGSSLIRLLTTASRCHWPAGETFAASSPPSTHLALPTAHSRKSLTGVTRSLTRSQARKHTRHTPTQLRQLMLADRQADVATSQPCNRATVRPVNNSTTQLAAMIKCLVNSYVRPTFRAEAPLPNGRALERAYRPIEMMADKRPTEAIAIGAMLCLGRLCWCAVRGCIDSPRDGRGDEARQRESETAREGQSEDGDRGEECANQRAPKSPAGQAHISRPANQSEPGCLVVSLSRCDTHPQSH